jgi:hypothetical protein
MEKIKILFLAANPTTTTPLRLDEEVRAITQKIRASEYRDSLSLISSWAVRADDLIQLLNEHKPHIVHFSGHGSRAGEIILVNDNGQPHSVSAVAIKSLFKTLRDNVRIVVLNACFSHSQANAITEVIDCAVGMSTAISDKAATIFAASFYRAIGFGRSVQEAFEQAVVALMLEGINEDSTPELLYRDGVDPSRIRLLVDRSSETQASSKGLEVVDVRVIDDREEIIAFRKMWLPDRGEIRRQSSREFGRVEKKAGVFPLIDIKVRNTSDTPAFLKRIEFKVNDCEAVPDIGGYLAFPVSWEYNILLNPHVKQDLKRLEISQLVKPNDVDRFVVIVGHTHGYGELSYAKYNVTLTLLFNENESIELGTFDIKVTAPVDFLPQEPSSIIHLDAG